MLHIRYKCLGYFSIPSIFLELLSFHFTSNSLFDFCCVILRFPLICFLPQLRKLGCFVREPKLAGTICRLVYYGVAPLLKNNPEKFHFGIKNPLDLWHLMRLAYLLRHTGLMLYRIGLLSREKIYDTSFLHSHFLKIQIIKKL